MPANAVRCWYRCRRRCPCLTLAALSLPTSLLPSFELSSVADSGNPSEKSCISICWRRCLTFFTGIRMEIIVFNSALNVFQLALKAKLHLCVVVCVCIDVCVCTCMCVNGGTRSKFGTIDKVQV